MNPRLKRGLIDKMSVDPVSLIGVIGAIVIVIAWASVIRAPPPPPRLSMIYAAGSMLLTIYAWLRGDPVFTLLNAAAFGLAVVNAVRARRARVL